MYDAAGQFLDSIYYQEMGKKEEEEEREKSWRTYNVHLFAMSGLIPDV